MTDDLIGSRLDKYHIDALLGTGGMATVYRAYQESLNRHVAVKVLAGQLAHDEAFRKRFEREAKAVAQFSHPNVVPVYDYGEDLERDVLYFVTQMVEGGTLSDHLGEPLPLRKTVRIIGEVAEALDYAHRHGTIHRDVKPSNILLTEDERPLLSDFGIARIFEHTRLTQTGTSLGTAAYMSPEQAKGEPLGPAADIYSLAVVCYEMLTGRPPFQAHTDIAVLHQQVYEQPPYLRKLRPDVPRRLEKVILKALAKEPTKRYPTAGAFAQALERTSHAASPLHALRPAAMARSEESAEEPPTIIRKPESEVTRDGPPPKWRRAGYLSWRATKWILGKLAAAVTVLTLVAAVLLVVAAFALSAVARQAIAGQAWYWEGWQRGGTSTTRQEELEQALQAAVEPYALGALTDLGADLDPPDTVIVRGSLRQRPLALRARLDAENGVLQVRLESLNGAPLYLVGGIVSEGMNEGLKSAWQGASVRLSSLEVEEEQIQVRMVPQRGHEPPTPSPTATPRNGVLRVVNQLDSTVTLNIDDQRASIDPEEDSDIELPVGIYSYTI
ncbi:MAG: protein kinase domain-containing protein, partial [Anaerolineae bacterium]